MVKIEIPKFAKIKNYRTMNKTKKDLAVEGNKKYQLEWMKEEINEFYEAINNQDEAEILDEAIGLIRAAQQFSESKRVLFWWEKIYTDVKTVLSNKQKFDKAFVKWKKRKTRKKQALDVTKQSLIDFAKLFK